MTDQEIIDCVLGGDRAAFGELVRRYQDSVYRMAMQRTRCARDSEDIAQEVFLNVYRRLGSYRGSAKFSTWLYRVTFNTCIDWLRKTRRPSHDAPFIADEYADTRVDIAGAYLAAEEQDEVSDAISRLPERYRRVIELSYFERLSHTEIGTVLGIAEKGVETRLYRARRALRRLLQEKGREV